MEEKTRKRTDISCRLSRFFPIIEKDSPDLLSIIVADGSSFTPHYRPRLLLIASNVAEVYAK